MRWIKTHVLKGKDAYVTMYKSVCKLLFRAKLKPAVHTVSDTARILLFEMTTFDEPLVAKFQPMG